MMNDTLQIRHLTVKNRIAIPPMVCFHWAGDDGLVSEKHLAHYRDLARGGAGLIIVEATAVSKKGRLHNTELGLWEDRQIEGFRQIADAIHENGAAAFVQLVYAGGNGFDPDGDAPSTMPYRGGRCQGREMNQETIDRVVGEFAAAALRAKKAGFDGVELHGCHGYLICCYFNSRTNLRTDAYGQDKSRFAKEVFQAVRKACGEDFVVGIRLGAFEPTLEDGLRNARDIAGYTDFINASYGGSCDPFAPEGFPCSAAVYGAKRIKEILPDMPVFGVDGINSRRDVENALATGIDMAVVGRVSLVDPAFARHVLNGEESGHCLHCDHYCRWNPPTMADPDAICPGYRKYHKE